MGRGDQKSKKGKIAAGSFGVSRKRKAIKERMKRIASKPSVESGETPKKKKTTRKKADA